jgi:sugar (pentulose or hexulose) kinase
LLDERGEARSNVMTWKDQRALEPSPGGRGTHFDDLKRIVSEEDQQRLGGEMRVGVPVTTLYVLQGEGKLSANLVPATLPDYIMCRLCGTVVSTEPTLASAQGLYNTETGDWHRGLFERLGLDLLRWPRIRKTGEAVGVANIDGHALTCYTPIGDQQCALLGSGLRERELSLNIATGAQASLLGRDRPRGDFQVRPYFDRKWLRTIVSIPAGRSLGLLVGLLTELGAAAGLSRSWDYIQQAVDQVAETDLEVDLSFFPSVSGDRGHITNIREGNLTVGHLFAAAFRGMALNFARCASTLSPGREWDRVVFSGGLAQNFERIRTEILDGLGNPIHRLCSTEEDTLAGLLALANVCSGRARSFEEAANFIF